MMDRMYNSLEVKEVTYITLSCNWCDDFEEVLVRVEDFEKYTKGAFVQDAFPYLSPSQREMIISKTCQECWNKMFRSED